MNKIAVIKATIKKVLPDAEIMLCGSRARNDARMDSDYDILIKINNQIDVREKYVLRTRIRKELLSQGIRSDIMIQSFDEIEQKIQLPGHIIRNLMKDAIAL